MFAYNACHLNLKLSLHILWQQVQQQETFGLVVNHRTVRTEASGVLGAMAKTVGKGLAPYLKALAGSWWLAQFDLHAEAAAAARDAFQAAFAGPKQKEALLFTRTEVRIKLFVRHAL